MSEKETKDHGVTGSDEKDLQPALEKAQVEKIAEVKTAEVKTAERNASETKTAVRKSTKSTAAGTKAADESAAERKAAAAPQDSRGAASPEGKENNLVSTSASLKDNVKDNQKVKIPAPSGRSRRTEAENDRKRIKDKPRDKTAQAGKSGKRDNKRNGILREPGLMPLLHTGSTTADCMFLVILAMLPAAGAGIYHYGVRAMFLIGLGVAAAVLTELVCDLIFRRGLTILDYSCVVTGLCVGLIMPPSAPYRFPVIASVIAIFSKMIFGGIGKNFLNPAALGKLVLVLLFPAWMTDFSTVTGTYGPNTPLQELLNGNEVTLMDMLTGNVSGCIGTTSVIAILLGALFLMAAGVIDAQISLGCLISFTIFYVLFGSHGLSLYFIAAQLCGGSLLFTAFFMANDYTTSPVGKRARIVDGLILGILIGIFRCFFNWEENASLYALLITNVLVRALELRLMPRPFGTRTLHRTLRVHAPMPAMENNGERPKTPEELANARMEADFAEFERSVLPKDAAQGSETAGTINSESVSMYENRRTLSGGLPPLPTPPVYGQWQGTLDQNNGWNQYPPQNGAADGWNQYPYENHPNGSGSPYPPQNGAAGSMNRGNNGNDGSAQGSGYGGYDGAYGGGYDSSYHGYGTGDNAGTGYGNPYDASYGDVPYGFNTYGGNAYGNPAPGPYGTPGPSANSGWNNYYPQNYYGNSYRSGYNGTADSGYNRTDNGGYNGASDGGYNGIAGYGNEEVNTQAQAPDQTQKTDAAAAAERGQQNGSTLSQHQK